MNRAKARRLLPLASHAGPPPRRLRQPPGRHGKKVPNSPDATSASSSSTRRHALPRLTDEWETVSTIDATSSSWWQRAPHWTQVEKLPGFTTPRPLGNVKPLISPVGNSLVELPPTSPAEDLAWQAYLLPVRNVGEPHAVEIEVPPQHLRQHLTVSIIEPDAAGRVQTLRSRLGRLQRRSRRRNRRRRRRVDVHRIVFWPRSKSPAVVIANRSARAAALYGKIRLQRRKTADPPSEAPDAPGRPRG